MRRYLDLVETQSIVRDTMLGMNVVATRAETDIFFEMAGLQGEDTGLPFYVWASPKAGARHDARLKVSPSFKYDPENESIVALRPAVRVNQGKPIKRKSMLLLAKWIELNFDAIIGFWDEEYNQKEFERRIKKI